MKSLAKKFANERMLDFPISTSSYNIYREFFYSVLRTSWAQNGDIAKQHLDRFEKSKQVLTS